MPTTIAIAILNYNGEKILPTFLPSVITHSPQVSIYLIDNASTDNSISLVKQQFPSVHIIQNPENQGYAGGYNLGLKSINADYLCLLNSDVEVTPNWIFPILQTFNSNPSIHIIQPKILSYRQKSHFEYAGAAGGYLDLFGYPFCRGRIFDFIEPDNGQYNTPSAIFWASGACLFIRKSTFDALSGFDPHFFAHQEEIDLCWRAFNRNYNAFYCPTSVVYHLGGATLSSNNPKKVYLNFRNNLLMLLKNLPASYLLPIIFSRLLLDGLAGLNFLLHLKPLFTLAIIKAHFSFYSKIPLFFSKREKTQHPDYHLITSIVFSHFIKKINSFSLLKTTK